MGVIQGSVNSMIGTAAQTVAMHKIAMQRTAKDTKFSEEKQAQAQARVDAQTKIQEAQKEAVQNVVAQRQTFAEYLQGQGITKRSDIRKMLQNEGLAHGKKAKRMANQLYNKVGESDGE